MSVYATCGVDCPIPCDGRCRGGGEFSEATEKSPFALTLVRRSQLRALPAVEPLIDGVMSLRSTVVFVGPTGGGKTFVALSWACSIGTGHNWLGHTVHQCRVLYTVGEGANGLDNRVSAWEQAWQTKVEDDQVIWSVRPASLRELETWIQMRAEALALAVRVVILDTFSSLAPDADETKDAATLRRMADLAAAIDGTVILVHHPGWADATRARGGSQLEANADEVLILHGNGHGDLVEFGTQEGQGGSRLG
jgi:RecA-family ATPase